MSRKSHRYVIALAALAAAASGTAFADDNSMSRLTGDSYAFFNNLDFSPGKFNTARASQTDKQTDMAKAGNNNKDGVAPKQSPGTERKSSAVPTALRSDTGA
jgi:hypothetical protein